MRIGRSANKRSMCERAPAIASSRARCAAVQPAVEPIGRGYRQQTDVRGGPPPSDRPASIRLWCDRTRIGHDDLGSLVRVCVASNRHRRSTAQVPASSSRLVCSIERVDKPQINGVRPVSSRSQFARDFPLGVALDVIEGKLEDRCKLIDEGRLEGGESVLRHADQRRSDRLVRTAFRGKRYARRGATRMKRAS